MLVRAVMAGARWLVVSLVLVAGLAGEAMAQRMPRTPQVSPAERVAREWALRGVVISGRRRSAVLEHLPSGRRERVVVGGAVLSSVTVATIEPDRVVLDVEPGRTMTLRLGHGGAERGLRRPAAGGPPRVPRTPLIRRRAR